MALTTSFITGRMPLPDDAAPGWGEVIFTLTGYDTEGSDVIPGGGRKRYILAPDAMMPAGAKLWRNTEGARGRAYHMLGRWHETDREGNHIRECDFGLVQVGDEGSYTIAELLDSTPFPTPTNTYWSSIAQAEYDDFMAVAEAAVAAAATVAAMVFETRDDADGAVIPAAIETVKTFGYSAVDDGGGADLAETADTIEPGGFTAADGRVFEIIPAPRYKPSPFGILPEDAGAAALIEDAAEFIWRKKGGGIIEFLPENYHVSQRVNINDHNIQLIGSGHSWHSNNLAGSAAHWNQFKGTRLTWTGAAGQTMMQMRPRVGAAAALVGCGISGLVFDGAASAGTCLEILSLRGGLFPSLVVSDATSVNLHLGVVPNGDISTGDPRDLQHCRFGRILTRTWRAASLSAAGIVLDGDDAADVSVCQFGEVVVIYDDGHGLVLNSSDACTFEQVFGFRLPGGTGNGIRLNGGVSVADFPRKHVFLYAQPGPGGLRVVKNNVAPSDNTCVVYSLGNATPEPVVDMGCGLPIHMYDTGSLIKQNPVAAVPTLRHQRGDQIASGFLSDLESFAYDSAGNADRMTRIRAHLASNTSAAESASISFETRRAGTIAERMHIGAGVSIGAGAEMLNVLSATAALDFPSVAAGSTQSLTMTVTGAATGMPVVLGMPPGGGHGALVFTAFVSAADTVTVRAHNPTSGAIDLPPLTIRAMVVNF